MPSVATYCLSASCQRHHTAALRLKLPDAGCCGHTGRVAADLQDVDTSLLSVAHTHADITEKPCHE